MNMNTIVFQIRPAADAFYRSELEPWSYWLSGENGKDPGWDPLEFAATECHKRSLEIHVWLNPYRVNTPSGPSTLSPLSPANKYPFSILIGKVFVILYSSSPILFTKTSANEYAFSILIVNIFVILCCMHACGMVSRNKHTEGLILFLSFRLVLYTNILYSSFAF